MRYYIIAGEASGDLHASNLVASLKNLDAEAEFRGWGGNLMKKQGVELVKHYKDTAYMGFTEVVLHLREILHNINMCKEDISKYKPDAIILVDYPGFNLRIAEYATKKGFSVFYYISPQVWAWKKNRVHKIIRSSDRLFVILPFEKDFYQTFGYDVTFVGHPLLDVIHPNKTIIGKEEFLSENNLADKPIIALLPGSRKQEVKRILAVMVSVVNDFPDYQFVVSGLSSIPEDLYSAITGNLPIKIITDKTYSLLSHSEAALVTSGTATLETALFNVPQVICYKGGSVSYLIAKQLVKIKYIGLVNLIMDKPVVKELIQGECNRKSLSHHLSLILKKQEIIEEIKRNYRALYEKLGGKGASGRTAEEILKFLK